MRYSNCIHCERPLLCEDTEQEIFCTHCGAKQPQIVVDLFNLVNSLEKRIQLLEKRNRKVVFHLKKLMTNKRNR